MIMIQQAIFYGANITASHGQAVFNQAEKKN